MSVRLIVSTLLAACLLVGIVALLLFLPRPAIAPVTDEQLIVGATIFPLADIARAVGGDRIRVQLLIPPGTSEHSSALNPQQLAELQAGRVIYAIGHGLEDQMLATLTEALPIPIVTVDKGITLREFAARDEHEEHEPAAGSKDPHYWLTVPNAQKIAETIARDLQTRDPEHTAAYQENLVRYQQELSALEAELSQMASGVSQRHFIAMHNAWSYFAEHYGLELVATYEPTEGHEPSLQDLQHLREIIGQYTIKTFYAEPQKASSAATKLVGQEFGLNISTLDPIGGIASADSYIKLMRSNMAAIVAGQ